jgi:hypothetical protein
MIKKKLIFYQSTAELVEIIQILKKSPYNSCVIVITGGVSLFNIIKKTKLKKKFGVSVYEFHAFPLKNPLNILRMYFRFNYSKDVKKILSIEYKEVIFFNYGPDFVAPIFLCKINTKKLKFINFYKKKLNEGNPGAKQMIQMFIIKIFYKSLNVRMVYDKKFEEIFFYPIDRKIEEFLPSNKILKSIIDFPIPKRKKTKKNIIYLDGNDESFYGNKFKKILLKIFDLLDKNGFNIIIKKHPIINLSNCLKYSNKWSYNLDPVPIELYNLSEVKFIFGLNSTSLAKAAEKFPNIKAFSFLRLIMSKKIALQKEKFLKNMLSAGIIYYPDSIGKIKKLIELKRK